mmetsp:Transcript_39507/g.62466  ORF Transcript_39507/g.62466 Transcript_39507/m.62466 type:complete len:261 (-) Transcript_39507:9-791(-)
MPQNEHIELAQKRFGRRPDASDRLRKKESRDRHKISYKLKNSRGLKAKLSSAKRFREKAEMRKKIRLHEQKQTRGKSRGESYKSALPAFLMDRSEVDRGKILSNSIKQKRKEKAGKWTVPIPQVKSLSEEEMFQVVSSGKRGKKNWKRVINKVSFVGENFTRKNPKYERFIRPMGLRFKKAQVTHPELRTTFSLPIIGVKQNPQSKIYTTLGVMTRGTIIEVNVSELGLVTPSGKVVWGKYAQITNNPELDGTINALMLV